MTALFDAIYDYFSALFNTNLFGDYFDDITFDIGSGTLNLSTWFVAMFTIISFIIILVLCCLFVYRIIRLVGGLISR